MQRDSIAKINFPLPFYIPIKDKEKIIRHYNDFATFKFHCQRIKNDSFKAKAEVEEYCTLIVMEFMFDKDIEDVSYEDFMRRAVLNSIIYLNNFLDALRLINDWEFIKNFSITDLPPVIEIEINGKLNLYITAPTTVGLDKIPLDTNQVMAAQDRLTAWDSNQYFEVIDKFLSKGIHHLHREEFIFAIVELQTSFESYIRLCQNLILTKQGADESKIKSSKNIAFRNTIEDHIGRTLGEDFNFINNSIINEWYSNLYMMRNKIVHSGLSYISGEEAYEAYDSLDKVVRYINGLMVSNGFMEPGGQIEIAKLNKNIKENVDYDKVFEKLKKKGFFD